MLFSPVLLNEVRSKFAHVDACPFTGDRIFFENAGGALTLKSVVETTAIFAAIPDNQGRDNPASKELVRVIDKARSDARILLNAPDGQIVFGESGTEMLFRMIRNAATGTQAGGAIISSTLEHPASRSAAAHWAVITGREHIVVSHDDATGTITADAYRAALRPDLRVATIIHTSPVTGMGVDVASIAAEIRHIAPECLIIVDGIQHAAHGHIDIQSYAIDGYAISPYKMFSRHGYGMCWVSDRLSALPHENLHGGPEEAWELGTRDTGSYATLSDVVSYLEWLGGEVSTETDRRARIEAAASAIHQHEHDLTEAAIHGIGNHTGLAKMDRVQIIGGTDNPAREGLVSCWVNGMATADVVTALNARGIRTHTRKADHYSGNILIPLGQPDCVRISFCHYNTEEEVARLLDAMAEITA